MSEKSKKEIIIHGIAASPGISQGPALVIREHSSSFSEPPDISIESSEAKDEIASFRKSLENTRNDLYLLRKRMQEKLNSRESGIFDAHLLIVDDQILISEVEDFIVNRLKSAEYAFFKVIERYITAISAMEDSYIKERADDIRDVASRILGYLREKPRPALDFIKKQSIIITHNLTPSDTALLDRNNVSGFAIEAGSGTCHTAILARSLHIPSIVGVAGLLNNVDNDDELIIDGYVGTIVINPSEDTIKQYREKEKDEKKFYTDLEQESQLRPETTDGFAVQLAANMETLNDLDEAKKFGASGIGLFRTEYLYMSPTKPPPDEENLLECFKTLSKTMKDQPIVIRTLDIGGDKLNSGFTFEKEANPFLGLRGIRLCLKEHQNILKDQIRAILRAGSEGGDFKIMLPMISCVEEIHQVMEIVDEVKNDLFSRGIAFKNDVELGIMIETPAAAVMAEEFAGLVDFFSIGTNDLLQYTIAIDRSNERLAYLHQPCHPAILRLIKNTVKAAENNQIWVSVCGEMAGDPRYTPILVGLGVHELSMSPVSLGAIRRIIRRMSLHEAEQLASEALTISSGQEIEEMSMAMLRKITPEIIDLAFKGL